MGSSSQKSLVEILNIKDSQIQSPIVSSQDLGWESIVVEEFKQPPGSVESGTHKEHTICLCLGTRPNRIWQTLGDRTHVGLYTKGDLTIAPAQVHCSYRTYSEDAYLQITTSPQFLEQIATEVINCDPTRLELVTEFCVRNDKIEQLAMMLRAELHQGNNGVGALYIESLANALIVNLLRDYSGTKPRIKTYEGGLSDRQILQVTDYINDHLTQSIKLEDLATYLEISRFHFSRLFKKSTGISPHQYVMQQRVELAKRLLKKADKSLADVALDCGFNSQSHLGKYFRQMTGMTPRFYRNNQ
ncbi:AraC family transcriptional regulator [Hyella patelloides LEGE 07179]|uniref:AraC family transcriptional regulator n=1 Tax=Hyella patelloides LEGE 07179 TaxID=945734 RepID=A0A563VJA6_9CYAN|nr:AraC family transcriptional regulator [Hyella patelloides]VEP11397.1 AraC family transcriptional regulator [Hyella patelloides LEGE 07179]